MLDKLRSLASDTAVYGTSTVVQRFLTFLLTPLYTNFLTMSELGQVANLYSLIAFVNVLYAFGFESSFLRFYRKDADNRQDVYTHTFVTIAGVAALCSATALMFSTPCMHYLGLTTESAFMIFSLAVAIPLFDALTIIPFARLRMERRPRLFALLKFVVVAINVASNVILVVILHYGAVGVFLSGAISSAVGVVLFIPSILRKLRWRWNGDLFRELRQFGLPTLPSGFSAIMLQVADRPILTAMTDSATVGLYNANYRLGIPMMLFSSVFEYAWKPFYLSHADDPDAKRMFARVLSYFTLVSAILFLVLCFFIGNVVQLPFIGGRFIKETYWQGLQIVPIIAAAYYFTGVATNLAAGLHITKTTRYLPLATGAAAIANIALNLFLIPQFSYVGAAWATLGAYVISAAVMWHYSQRVYPIDYEWRRVGIILVVTVVVYAASRILCPDAGLTHTLWRIALLLFFIALLAALRFFSPREISFLRGVFSRSSTGSRQP